ncbi:TPR repeat [Crocosphaera watsonii WH 8501]|uniref:TPR repeat n=2 Tax=Crocosphaera watsonii TaxID=263511 RepID=Q4C311_CROWT|nr:TPR repeat [Crocosphaera watsonii WH 8501]
MTQMTTSVSNNVINNYIQRVTEWSQSSQRIPTTEELENIAAELGIDPEEIQAAQKQSHDHYVRSQGYMRLKHWNDAIAELQEAVAFNPSNLDMLVSLASAHMGRWEDHHRKDDEVNIRLRIRQCLVIKPDCEEALNLLAKLSHAIKWRTRIFTAIGVGLGGICVGIGGVFLLGDALPSWWQQPSQLELLEQSFNQELHSLQRQQQALRSQMIALQRHSDQRNQRTISTLQNRINQLQREVSQLERKIIEIEKEKPSKITPRSSNNGSILRGSD